MAAGRRLVTSNVLSRVLGLSHWKGQGQVQIRGHYLGKQFSSLGPALCIKSTVSKQPTGLSVQSYSAFHTTLSSCNEHIFNVQDEADFNERVVKNAAPVVVDFHATWCGPCKLLGPRLEALISAKKGKVLLAKIDIDEMQDLAVQHNVEAVPTVLAMKNGKVVDKFVGLKDDAELESFLLKLIN